MTSDVMVKRCFWILCGFIATIALLYATGDIMEIIHAHTHTTLPRVAAEAGLSEENFQAAKKTIKILSTSLLLTNTLGSMLLIWVLQFQLVGRIWSFLEKKFMNNGPFIKAAMFRLSWTATAVGLRAINIIIDGTRKRGLEEGPLGLITLFSIAIGELIFGLTTFFVARKFRPSIAFALMVTLTLSFLLLRQELGIGHIITHCKPFPRDAQYQEIWDLVRRTNFPEEKLLIISGINNAFYAGAITKECVVIGEPILQNMGVLRTAAVVAHELGHRKYKHVLQGIIRMSLQPIILQGLFFFLVLPYPAVFSLFGLDTEPTIVGLSIAEFLLSRINDVAGILELWISRLHEYQADGFSCELGYCKPLAQALLTLEPAFVSHSWLFEILHMTHPTPLKRAANVGVV